MSKNLVRTKLFPYHIVARANNKRPFPVELDWLWMKMVDALNFASWAYGLKVHSFVLMPNHFHLIASTKGDDLGVVMNYFMREIAIQTNRRAGQINRMWGGRYKWSIVDCEHYLGTVVRYVYRNPMRGEAV